MEPDLSLLPDLIVEHCIPDCNECPGIWKNEYIKHKIICRCKACDHVKVIEKNQGVSVVKGCEPSIHTNRAQARSSQL